VKAELPGVEEKDLDLQLAEGMLTIKGEKKQEREEGEKGKGYYMMERSYGSFFRRIPLPTEVQEDKVEARFKNGVLMVSLPKSPEATAKVKRIEVKSG
jgi:HSP20 family protein